MNDINFDLFRKEISFAEDYLRTNVSQSSLFDGTSASKTRLSRENHALEAEMNENGSHLLSRRSLASSENFANTKPPTANDNYGGQFYKPSFDGVSDSMDSYWIEGGRPPQALPEDWCSNRDQSLARYADPYKREKLIERLLADHEQTLMSSYMADPTPTSGPLSRYDDSNSSMLQHKIEQLSVDSADSLDSASGNQDTLFFASDLNPPINNQDGHLHARSDEDEPDYINMSGDNGAEREALSYDMASKLNNTDCNISNANDVHYNRKPLEFSNAARESSYTARMYNSKTLNSKIVPKARDSSPVSNATAEATIIVKDFDDNEEERGTENIHDNHSPTTFKGARDIRTFPGFEGRKSLAGSKAVRVKKLTPSKASEPAASSAETPPADQKKRFHKSREQLQEEATAQFKVQCAFKPSIITAAANYDRNRDPARGSRIEEMHVLYKKSREEREKRKKEHLLSELGKCTFQPVITKMGVRATRSSPSAAHFNAVDYLSGGSGYVETPEKERVPKGISGSVSQTSMRLHREAEQRSAQQRWLEKQVEEARLAQFSFQPAINPANTSFLDDIDHRPIYERVGELQRERESRRRDLKQSHDDSLVDLTFTPQIDSKSRKIAQRRLEAKDSEDLDESCSRSLSASGTGSRLSQHDVGARLHGEAALAARRKEQLRSEREGVLVLEMEPVKISKGSDRLAQQSPHVGVSFVDRQAIHSKRVQEKSTALHIAAEIEGAAWFKPEIGRSSKIAASARPHLLNETMEERVKRMSQEAANEIETRRKAKENELYRGLTFAPDIDSLSRAIGRSRGLEELVYNRGGEKVRATAKKAQSKVEKSTCTFKPSINTYPAYAVSRCVADIEKLEEAEERRYNADLTPVGWAESFLGSMQNASFPSSSYSLPLPCPGEEGDTDEDSLGPMRHPRASSRRHSSSTVSGDEDLDDLMGIRSRHFDGKHQQSKSCTVNLSEPERMSRNIREQQAAKEAKRREELIARDMEEMKECTFQPFIKSNQSNRSFSRGAPDKKPVVVRGLGRHLELKHLSLRQREEAYRREIEVFTVKNIDSFRRGEDGSTIVKPFVFSETPEPTYSRT